MAYIHVYYSVSNYIYMAGIYVYCIWLVPRAQTNVGLLVELVRVALAAVVQVMLRIGAHVRNTPPTTRDRRWK